MNPGGTLANQCYPVLRKLAQGGMGAVYRAVDTRTGAVVALKVLPPEVVRDDIAGMLARHDMPAMLKNSKKHHGSVTG